MIGRSCVGSGQAVVGDARLPGLSRSVPVRQLPMGLHHHGTSYRGLISHLRQERRLIGDSNRGFRRGWGPPHLPGLQAPPDNELRHEEHGVGSSTHGLGRA
jgi:hypothetical protein